MSDNLKLLLRVADEHSIDPWRSKNFLKEVSVILDSFGRSFKVETLQSAFLIEKYPFCPCGKQGSFKYEAETIESGKCLKKITEKIFRSTSTDLNLFVSCFEDYRTKVTSNRAQSYQTLGYSP